MGRKEGSTEKLYSFIDFLNHKACILDKDGNIEKLNSEWRSILEEAKTDLLNVGEYSSYLENCEKNGKEECQRFAKALRGIIQGKKDFFEMAYTDCISGETRDILARAYPLTGLDDTKLMVEHIDITGVKSKSNQGKKAQELNEKFFKGFPYPAWLVDYNRQILSQNQVGKTMFGSEIGDTCWFSFHGTRTLPEDQRKYYEEMGELPPGARCYFCRADEALSSGQTIVEEVELDGVVFETGWVPLDDDIYLHYAIDVTRYEREEMIRSIINGAKTVSLIVTDLNSIVKEFSPGAEAIFGYKREEILGKHIGPLHTSSEVRKFPEYIEKLKKDREGFTVETELVRKSGEKFPALFTIQPLFDNEGNISETLGISVDISAQKYVEKKLQESEERYRQLFENSPVSLWVQDFSEVKHRLDQMKQQYPDILSKDDLRSFLLEHPRLIKELAASVKIVDMNKATLNLYKAKDKKELLSGITTVFAEESYEDFISAPLAIFEGETEFFVEKNHLTLGGDPLRVQLHWSVAPGHENTYSRVLVSIVDVTDQRETEKALREERDLKQRYLDAVEAIIVYLDGQGNISMLNRYGLELLGYSEEEIIGKNWFKTVLPSPEDIEQIYPVFLQVTQGDLESVYYVENEVVTANGERRMIAWKNNRILDEEGGVVGAISAGIDITDKKQAEERLRESRNLLESVFESIQEGICVLSRDLSIRHTNTALKEQFKDSLPLEEKKCYQLFQGADATCTNCPVLRSFRSGSMESEEMLFFTDRGKRWLEVFSYPLWERGTDEPTGAVEFLRDITDRKISEKIMQSRIDIMTFAADHSLDEVLQKCLDEACDILDSPIGFFHFVEDEEKTIVLKAWSTSTLKKFCRMGNLSGKRYPLEEAGVWADAVRERQPVIHNDYNSLYHRRGLPKDHAPVIREIVVPLMRQGEIVAVLGAGNKGNEYTEKEVQLLSYFAEVAWDVVERKRAEEQIRYLSFYDHLTGLYNRAYFEEEIKRLDTERQLPISIIMADLNGLKLVNDTYGHDIGDKMLKEAAKILRNSCRSEDIVARWGGDEFVILLPQTLEEELESIENRIIKNCKGVYVQELPVSLSLGSGVKKTSNEKIKQVLKEAEDNMYKHKLAESRSARSSVLYTLLKTLGEKSYETEAHTQRMQIFAWKIGEKIGLSHTELNRLQLLITLHDIGKINLPKEMLTREGQLTSEEWEMIKEHPAIGYRIAKATEEFAHVAEEILSHHERWDGKGYPRGLKGEEIPLLARITAIVDAYDVMSNGRPYKKAMRQEEVINELRRCAGTQFDPELVDIFMEIIENQY